MTTKSSIVLSQAQCKAYTELCENKDKHVILYSEPGMGKTYLLSYFLYSNKSTFCIIYDKLTFVQDFKEQLSHFFPSVDNIIFIHKSKWKTLNFSHYNYVISTFQLDLPTDCNIINIIFSDNILYDNIKIIKIETFKSTFLNTTPIQDRGKDQAVKNRLQIIPFSKTLNKIPEKLNDDLEKIFDTEEQKEFFLKDAANFLSN